MNSTYTINFDKVCRGCLSNDFNTLNPLFHSNRCSMFISCTNVKVECKKIILSIDTNAIFNSFV